MKNSNPYNEVEISIKQSIETTPKKDHVVNIVKATLSAIPIVGGPLASLMGDYIPKKKEERLVNFINEIAVKLEEYSNEINKEYIKTDEFSHILEGCLKGVLNNYQQQKILCFKGILINSLRRGIEQERKEYYLYLVDNLTEVHLRILALSNDPENYFRLYNLDPNKIYGDSIGDVFKYAFVGIDQEVVKTAYSELYQMGLLNTDKSIFGVLTASRGFDIVKGRVTRLGSSFIEFCVNY